MALKNTNRQQGTVLRDNLIHECYEELMRELGKWSTSVSRTDIYLEVSARTGAHWKTVQRTLNHTKKVEM